MKYKKIWKIIAVLVAILLIGFIISFANSFIGNPISKAMAKNTAEKYVAENYGDWDYQVGEGGYNFKFSEYFVRVESPRSPDRNFTIYTDGWGRFQNDDYEGYVTNGFNTWNRLEREMREEGERIFKDNMDESIEHARFSYIDVQEDNYGGALTLDMELDLNNPPIPMELYLNIYTEDVSWDKLAQVCLEAKEILEKEDIAVINYSIRLLPMDNKTPDGHATSWMNSLYVDEFPSEWVIEEDLAEVLETYQRDYENEMNKEKKY